MSTETQPEAQAPASSSTAPPLILYSPDKRYRFATPTSAEDDQVSILRSDPRTLRYLRFMPQTISIPEVAARRESRLADPKIIDFNVFDEANGKLVGMTGVFDFDEFMSRCEAGIVISPEATGKGLASVMLYTVLKYAFEERGIHRVTFETGEDNAPMRGWLEKVAEARVEATRLSCWRDGQGGWTDVKGYAIVDFEWRDRVKPNLEKRLGIAEQATEEPTATSA
ncbi:acyl-CoA N-acyltransferase [Coprinopsis sp. MPI-PUGE-AT-0042]|nr:acyl-CoA N-acyltransferase [Coprinopsis sp. MPI-PUGE-AT-0042]